ncbi:MAG: HNH endonuclease [Candidatus Krumholzibacteria bacterium]|nr:HNH endonuclease [Candidatus Krumholzibacteria bacterium]
MSELSYIPDQPAAEVHASLQRSLIVLEEARQCSVLWFGEVMRRGLYRDLGHSSINQYAIQELGFSKSRTDDFIRLARELENLPAVREAVASGELGYTKAREIVSVATPETQDEWLKAAKGTRKELVNEVKKVKRAAKVDSGQGELLPSSPTVVAPCELPVYFKMKMTPEQEARRSALVERLHKLGGVPTDRVELMLEGLATLAETIEAEKCPQGHFASRPPVQIHVHENAETGRMIVQTDAGERELSRAESERMRCDAAVCEHGGRNTTTIPPRVRREVLARDLHRCQAPGCGRTRFLEVHHIKPRNRGGDNQAENLVTLCASCHRLWHERGGGPKIHETVPVSDPRDVLY